MANNGNGGGPLEGLRVLDTTQYLSGPYCSQLLGDLGADVIKIEQPDKGDIYRRQGPIFLNGESITFLALNRNKRSVTLDLKNPEDLELMRRLVAEVDVFLENLTPGVMARLGLGYEDLRAINPGIIYCSISGYGQTGPKRKKGGYDLMLQGEGGIMSVTGEQGQAPVKVGVSLLDYGTAMYAAIGILAAYIHRQKTGEGQHVDTSLLDCAVSWQTTVAAAYWASGEVPGPMGSRSPLFAPYQALPAKDRWITVIGTGGKDSWGQLCRVMGLDDLIEDPRFDTNAKRVANLPELEKILGARLSEKTADEWIALMEEAGLPCGPINTVDRVLEEEQVRARELVIDVEHPKAGKYHAIGFPIKFSKTPAKVRHAPPALGENNDEVLKPLRDKRAGSKVGNNR